MITVIFAIKDRCREVVSRCLDSLSGQKCQIIVVDYGSQDTSWYQEVVGNFVSAGHGDPDFNKAKALNIAIRLATTSHIISSDIDNVFGKNFIEVASQEIYKPWTLLMCERTDIQQDGSLKDHPKTSYGACFGIDRSWLMEVHGYDEGYVNWGKEDDDLYRRALLCGYKPVWIGDRTTMLHQYHLPASRKSLKSNASRLVHSTGLIRNETGWGKLNSSLDARF